MPRFAFSGVRRPWQAFGLALSLEAMAVLGLLVLSASQPAVVREVPMPLTFDLPADRPAAHPEPPQPPKPPVPERAPSPRVPAPKALLPAPNLPAAAKETPPAAAAPVEPVTSANAAIDPSEVPRVPAPARVLPVASEDVAAAYNARLAAAVQAAFEVPMAASSLGFKGRSRVEFTLRDGVLGAVRLVQGSGLAAVDRAALRAVSAAAFPAPPAPLQGREASYQIWVACF